MTPSGVAAAPDAGTVRLDAVLGLARPLARELAQSPEQRDVVDAALLGFAPTESRETFVRSVDTPVLVYAALTGQEPPAWPLAAATVLADLGIRILDELADEELADHWRSVGPGELSLVAICLTAVWPQAAIQRLDAPAATRAAMAARLAQGLAGLAAGQQLDLRQRGASVPDPAALERAAVGKSGEGRAAFAALAALLAGETDDRVELCAALGRALGTAAQLASDCHDLFDAKESRDLANRTRTLPIAFGLAHVDGAQREDLVRLIDGAGSDPTSHDELRRRLIEVGALRRCAVVVETYCQGARRLLRQLEPREPGRAGLEAMIDGLSFFPS